jgi:chromate transport protein ChrA
MAAQSDTSIRPWLRGLYPLGALLIAQPVLEVVAAAWPLRFGEVGWRFGVTGSFLLLVGTFVVGIGVIVLAAWLLGHRIALRVTGIVSLVIAVCMVLAAASFALDYVQLRRLVRPDLTGRFNVTGLRAGVSMLLAIIALSVLGWSGIRASRPLDAKGRTARRTRAGQGLIVGR